jgi:excisionase family DNA binding protein
VPLNDASVWHSWIMPSNPPYLTTGQAARLIGVHPTTLTRWTEAGKVTPALTTAGGHFRWDLDDLKRQLDELNTEPWAT